MTISAADENTKKNTPNLTVTKKQSTHLIAASRLLLLPNITWSVRNRSPREQNVATTSRKSRLESQFPFAIFMCGAPRRAFPRLKPGRGDFNAFDSERRRRTCTPHTMSSRRVGIRKTRLSKCSGNNEEMDEKVDPHWSGPFWLRVLVVNATCQRCRLFMLDA